MSKPTFKSIELPTRESWIEFDQQVLGYINIPTRRRDATGRIIVPTPQPVVTPEEDE